MKQLGEVYGVKTELANTHNPAKHACCREKMRITNPFFSFFFPTTVLHCVCPPSWEVSVLHTEGVFRTIEVLHAVKCILFTQ